jgi:hypothetical protein
MLVSLLLKSLEDMEGTVGHAGVTTKNQFGYLAYLDSPLLEPR